MSREVRFWLDGHKLTTIIFEIGDVETKNKITAEKTKMSLECQATNQCLVHVVEVCGLEILSDATRHCINEPFDCESWGEDSEEDSLVLARNRLLSANKKALETSTSQPCRYKMTKCATCSGKGNINGRKNEVDFNSEAILEETEEESLVLARKRLSCVNRKHIKSTESTPPTRVVRRSKKMTNGRDQIGHSESERVGRHSELKKRIRRNAVLNDHPCPRFSSINSACGSQIDEASEAFCVTQPTPRRARSWTGSWYVHEQPNPGRIRSLSSGDQILMKRRRSASCSLSSGLSRSGIGTLVGLALVA